MKLSIVIIGDEILLGKVTDTNSGLISRTLSARGWDTVAIRTTGDSAEGIRGAVEAALAEADLVITTGGLGATRDDITKGVMISIFGGEPIYNADVEANLEDIFAKRGIKINELTRTQAIVPSSARIIQNITGTAPIMWFERDGKVLITMPGVPFETRTMMPIVAEAVADRFHPATHALRRELTAINVSESAMAELLAEFEDRLPQGTHIAYLPSPGVLILRLDSADIEPDRFDELFAEMKGIVGENFVGEGVLSPAELCINLLRRRGATMATAESCTGGNIAHMITEIAGCSDVFVGGVVSYANAVKRSLLGVRESDLEAFGAVSEPVVLQMAKGTCAATGATYGVATSGIAGPGGGSAEKPVGTVWIAVNGPEGAEARCCFFTGDRDTVITRATATALMMLAERLRTTHNH